MATTTKNSKMAAMTLLFKTPTMKGGLSFVWVNLQLLSIWMAMLDIGDI